MVGLLSAAAPVAAVRPGEVYRNRRTDDGWVGPWVTNRADCSITAHPRWRATTRSDVRHHVIGEHREPPRVGRTSAYSSRVSWIAAPQAISPHSQR